ncbi:MAG: flagellar basal body-associated FliL family protein [Alphaproteobacteria bacterium]|nr:flagellar basal body-associated FliL family protein [Alphaproteobacteria bacterium]
MKGMKKKIIIVVVLLLVGVIGVAGYQFLADSEVGEAILAESVPDPVFYHMTPLYAPVLKGRKVNRYVTIGLILEVPNEEVKAAIHYQMTQLRNAFIDDLNFQSNMSQTDTRGVNLSRIKTRFKSLSSRVLGPDIVDEILISYATDRGY